MAASQKDNPPRSPFGSDVRDQFRVEAPHGPDEKNEAIVDDVFRDPRRAQRIDSLAGNADADEAIAGDGRWRWLARESMRKFTPPGWVIGPYARDPLLRPFWGFGAPSYAIETGLAVSLGALLILLDVWNGAPWWGAASLAPFRGTIAAGRFGAVLLIAALTGRAILSHIAWWRRDGRFDAIAVTRLSAEQCLPLFWLPPLTRMAQIYTAAFLCRALFEGDWLRLFQQGIGPWYRTRTGPASLGFTLIELLVATIAFRLATAGALNAGLTTHGASRGTATASGNALRIAVFAMIRSSFTLLILALAAAAAWLIFYVMKINTWIYFAFLGIGVMAVSRALVLELLEARRDLLDAVETWNFPISSGKPPRR